jgi:hypothetical protein
MINWETNFNFISIMDGELAVPLPILPCQRKVVIIALSTMNDL